MRAISRSPLFRRFGGENSEWPMAFSLGSAFCHFSFANYYTKSVFRLSERLSIAHSVHSATGDLSMHGLVSVLAHTPIDFEPENRRAAHLRMTKVEMVRLN